MLEQRSQIKILREKYTTTMFVIESYNSK